MFLLWMVWAVFVDKVVIVALGSVGALARVDVAVDSVDGC